MEVDELRSSLDKHTLLEVGQCEVAEKSQLRFAEVEKACEHNAMVKKSRENARSRG